MTEKEKSTDPIKITDKSILITGKQIILDDGMVDADNVTLIGRNIVDESNKRRKNMKQEISLNDELKALVAVLIENAQKTLDPRDIDILANLLEKGRDLI